MYFGIEDRINGTIIGKTKEEIMNDIIEFLDWLEENNDDADEDE